MGDVGLSVVCRLLSPDDYLEPKRFIALVSTDR